MTIRRVASLDQTDPQALSSHFFTSLAMGNVVDRVTMNNLQIPTPIPTVFFNNCSNNRSIIRFSDRLFEENLVIFRTIFIPHQSSSRNRLYSYSKNLQMLYT